MHVRQLSKDDWESWKQLRLEALQDSPSSFASSFEEEVHCADKKFQEDLIQSDIFGAFADDQLVACLGFYSLHANKVKHRGMLWGTYTKQKYRRCSIASRLIEAVIAHAKTQVTQLHLTCVTTNHAAIALYQNHGFKIYGTEPNSLKSGKNFFDEHLMVLIF